MDDILNYGMQQLRYSDLYNKNCFEGWTLLKDQLLTKMKWVIDGVTAEPGGYWGTYGATYGYVPWGMPVYLALRDHWNDFTKMKFFYETSFSQEFTYRKYYWDQVFTSSASTGLLSLPGLIVKGINSLMNCYKRADVSPSFESSSIYDLCYSDSSTSSLWQRYCEAYNVGMITREMISYNSFKLLGAHMQSSELIFALSEIICSFQYLVVYSKGYDSFFPVEVPDEA